MTRRRIFLAFACVPLLSVACASSHASSPSGTTEPAVIDSGPASLPCNEWTAIEIDPLREAAASTVFALDASDVAHFVGGVVANETAGTSGGYILHARVDRGATTTERIDFPPFEAFSPQAIALDSQGALHVVGLGRVVTSSGHSDVALRYFTNTGGAWVGETLVAGSAPAIAVGNGHVTVAYLGAPDPGMDPSVRVISNASSSWAPVATPQATSNGAPAISIDAVGDTRVAYATIHGVMVMSNETGLWAIAPASHEQSIGTLATAVGPDGLQLAYPVFTGIRIAHLDGRSPERVDNVLGDAALAIDPSGKRHILGLAADRLTPVRPCRRMLPRACSALRSTTADVPALPWPAASPRPRRHRRRSPTSAISSAPARRCPEPRIAYPPCSSRRDGGMDARFSTGPAHRKPRDPRDDPAETLHPPRRSRNTQVNPSGASCTRDRGCYGLRRLEEPLHDHRHSRDLRLGVRVRHRVGRRSRSRTAEGWGARRHHAGARTAARCLAGSHGDAARRERARRRHGQ
jgi:hypothetical protein